MEQEIVFAIARSVRTGASSQCHNGKQCQHNFFHVFSFCPKVHRDYTGPHSQKQYKKVEFLYCAAGVVYAYATYDNYIKSGIEPGIFPCQKCFGRAPQSHTLRTSNCVPSGGNGWAMFYLDKNNGFATAGNNINLCAARVAPGDIPRPQNTIPPHAQIHACPKFGK